jgi:hypothetical protein
VGTPVSQGGDATHIVAKHHDRLIEQCSRDQLLRGEFLGETGNVPRI